MKKSSLAPCIFALLALMGCTQPSGYTPTKVTSITINWQHGGTVGAYGNGIALNAQSPVQFTASVLPTNASDQAVTWSVTYQGNPTAYATIDANGILTSTIENDLPVVVMATADDGSGVSASLSVYLYLD